ncbi:hypothetical protein Tco_0584257 [Tanacetum coccineum]
MKYTFIDSGSDEMRYSFWDTNSHQVIRSKDMTFMGSIYEARFATDSSSLTNPIQKSQVVLVDIPENLAENDSIASEHGLSSEITQSPGRSSDTSEGSENSRSFEDSRRSNKEDSKDRASSKEGGSETPPSYSEALSSKESVQWKKAINEEIVSLEKNQTCSLVRLRAGKKASQILWMFKVKDEHNDRKSDVHHVGDEREVEVLRSFNWPSSELITEDGVLPERGYSQFNDVSSGYLGNILNHVETFATFDALDNVLSGYGTGCDVPSVGTPLASCSIRITGLYIDVFRKCFELCGVKSQQECSTTFRGSSIFVGGVGDGLDKRKLQPSGHSDVFEAYLALCSSGVGSRRLRSLSQITTVFNSNLVHTDFSSLCGPSASLPGRSFHANPNVVTITADSQNSYPVSRDGGNTRENCQLRRTGCRILTSGSTVDTTSIASAGTSYTYSDFEDCDRRCRYCEASFWYVERLKGHSHNQTPEYHLCCGGGRIQMQPPREPPEYIKSLFENKHFMENICAYNQMFAMTSFGAKIDESINAGRGSYVFKVSSQIYHWIGSLCLPAGEPPRELDIPEFKIRLYNAEGARGYELPTSNTLGAMVFESGISDNAECDVIIQHRDGQPQRVNKLHPSYMSLQFPLLFIYNQQGYHTELTLKSTNGVGRGKRVTMLDYYRY